MVDPGHTPLFELDQMAANLLPPDALARVSAHLSQCASCSARLHEIRSAQQAELIAHPPHAFVAKVLANERPKRPPLFKWISAVVPLAAAAVIALVVINPPDSSEDSILFKGAEELIVQAQRPGADVLERIHDSAELPAGTKLRLSVLPGAYRRVTIFAVDSEGKVIRVAAVGVSDEGIPVWLSLDDALGSDRIVAVFSDAAIAEEQFISELKRAFEEHGDVENMAFQIDGVSVDSVLIRKLGKSVSGN